MARLFLGVINANELFRLVRSASSPHHDLVTKALTRYQLEGRKGKAVRFVRDVLDDPDRAEEIADESLEEYAERRKIRIAESPRGETMTRVKLINPRRISNPERRNLQPNPQTGRSDLLARIRELQTENDELQDTLDKVADLAAAPGNGRDEDHDELVDRLNSIIDAVAPSATEDEEDEDEDDDSGND